MLKDGECEQPDVPKMNTLNIAGAMDRQRFTLAEVRVMGLPLSDVI
jgi:hypothetical protein